ncbi:diguanylate cyclase [Rhodoferax sp.]|uniref:GGDEF domain-containing protein n=1 Tax=Rhodoferax sp. TaxID=50421 RepID=UPI00374CE29E
MQLDILTLLVMTAVNLVLVSVALPVIMGRRISGAARCAQLSLQAQMLGWVAALASSYWWEPALSTVSIAFIGLSHWLMFRAMGGWLGTRNGERWLLGLMVLAPLGYALGFGYYPFRVGWSNLCLAGTLLILAYATLFPLRKVSRAWRWMLCACIASMALLNIGRGVLGAFFTQLYPNYLTPHPINLAASLGANMALMLTTVVVLVAWREEAEGRLRTLAMTDGLTGLLNRRGWTERAESMFANAQRYQQPLAMMMLDLDHFKRVNDTHGHEVGDKALKLFARLLRASRRTGDLVGRLGGEEFCIVLANTHRSASVGFDHRLRSVLREAAEKELGFAMDFSAGVAVLKDGDATLAGLLARADAALYEAKNAGRGRLIQSDGGVGHTVI